MSQFSVHRNLNPDSSANVPLLLNVQSDLIESLATCVVVPLFPVSALQDKTIRTLTPVLEIGGSSYLAMTPQLAGVSRNLLGDVVADLSGKRAEIMAALDLLITGF